MSKRKAERTKPSKEEEDLALQLFQSTRTTKKTATETGKDEKGNFPKPAWVDDDDADLEINLEDRSRLRKLRKTEEDVAVGGDEYQQRLKNVFKANQGAVSWADPKNFMSEGTGRTDDAFDSDSDDEEAIMSEEQVIRSTSNMLDGSTSLLPPGELEVCRVKDANQHSPSNAVIQSTQFHPNGQLLLTAALDKKLNLFQIDGSENRSVESVFLKDLPMTDAKFTLGGSRIVMTGPRSYYFSYDLEAGRVSKIPGLGVRKEKKLQQLEVSSSGEQLAMLGSSGFINLVSAKAYTSIGSLKMNGAVNAASFTSDDKYLLTTGSDGQVYTWDLRTHKCLSVQQDEGSLGTHALAVSGDNKYYATGSESGVVNVYDRSKVGSGATTPTKALMQLTTKTDLLKFNKDSQILAMASGESKDALKMVHVPSMTVFANWPTVRTPLQYVSAMDFSPSSGYFACGNARGRVLLYRLTHYNTT